VALSEVFWQLLLILHASPTPRPGDVAAAVAGTVEAVPGAAGPPPWPGSCVKVSTTAAALTPDERTTSSKAVADVAAAAVAAAAVAAAVAAAFAAAVAAAAVAALTLSGRETVLLCSHASRFIFLLSLSGRFLLFF